MAADVPALETTPSTIRLLTYNIRKGKGVPSPYGPHLWLDIRLLGRAHDAANATRRNTIMDRASAAKCGDVIVTSTSLLESEISATAARVTRHSVLPPIRRSSSVTLA